MGLKSVEDAGAFGDRVGIEVAWGKADLVLPSLWRGIAGLDADWAIRDENGKPTGFSPEFDRLWRWKDELPERRLACAGKQFGSAALLVAPRPLAAPHPLTARSGAGADFREEEPQPLQREGADAVGWRRKHAETVLAELTAAGRVTEREEDGLQLWSV